MQSTPAANAGRAFVVRFEVRHACAVRALALNQGAGVNRRRTFVVTDPTFNAVVSVAPRARTRSGANSDSFFVFCPQAAGAADLLEVRRIVTLVRFDVCEEDQVYEMQRRAERVIAPGRRETERSGNRSTARQAEKVRKHNWARSTAQRPTKQRKTLQVAALFVAQA